MSKFGVVRRGLLGIGATAVIALGTGACTVPAAEGGWFNGSNGLPPDPTATKAGGFAVSGRISPDGTLGTKTLALPNAAAAANASVAKKVSHVMAVTPSSQNTGRVVAAVSPTGDFSLDLDPARLWVLVLLDSSKVGSDMIVGVFRANGLHTIAPLKTGKADLGTITAKDGAAEGSIAYEDLLAAMGVDADSARYLASIDDLCLRVVNPDIDGNGQIDALEGDGVAKDYRLDFHVQFAMQTGHAIPVAVNDLLGKFLPDDVAISYGGTGIYTSFPSSVFPTGWESSRSASFDGAMHYAPLGGAGGTGPASARTAVAGATIPAADLSVIATGGSASIGLMAVPGFDMPQGGYRFGVGATTLTFTNVRTRTDAELTAASSFIMPFVRFVSTDPSCTTRCTPSAIDYVWRKRTDTRWVDATAGEVALVAGEQGGFLSIRLGGDASKNIGFTIPATAVSGQIAWNTFTTPDASTKAAALAAKTDALCHVGLSYDDKLGMRYFGNIEDAPDTCGLP